MDKDIATLVNLPWATLLTLASGYSGYFIANTGVRSHHKAIDVAFSTLVFGFFGSFAYQAFIHAGYSKFWASLIAFLAAIVIGGLWRKFGRDLMEDWLRDSDISYANDTPDAWRSIFKIQNADMRQITVKLTDGGWLHCADLRTFKEKPCGPCILGEAGDLLMYVTHQKAPGEAEFRELSNVDGLWGAQMTYLPKDKIALVDMRFKVR
ncbi:hypothetical protein ACCT14_33035 [Rhizobium brockwellii]|uniref:hypothetical protein n=1 Tax=Rhizobium brockwellii TaxID=3019932 RepID=UPI003F95F2D1